MNAKNFFKDYWWVLLILGAIFYLVASKDYLYFLPQQTLINQYLKRSGLDSWENQSDKNKEIFSAMSKKELIQGIKRK